MGETIDYVPPVKGVEPSVTAFNKAEKASAKKWQTILRLVDAGATATGIPIAPIRRDITAAVTPRADEMTRSVVAIKNGDDDAAKKILVGKMVRMLKADIPDYKIAASFARSLEARLNKGLDEKDPNTPLVKGANKAKAVTLAWEAVREANAKK